MKKLTQIGNVLIAQGYTAKELRERRARLITLLG